MWLIDGQSLLIIRWLCKKQKKRLGVIIFRKSWFIITWSFSGLDVWGISFAIHFLYKILLLNLIPLSHNIHFNTLIKVKNFECSICLKKTQLWDSHTIYWIWKAISDYHIRNVVSNCYWSSDQYFKNQSYFQQFFAINGRRIPLDKTVNNLTAIILDKYKYMWDTILVGREVNCVSLHSLK